MSQSKTNLPPGLSTGLRLALATLGVNLALFAFVAVSRPAYMVDYRSTTNPDAIQYVRLGHNYWTNGAYSRQLEPPWVTDVMRTPVYPLLAGGIESFFGSIWPLYLLQAVFGSFTTWFVYRIGRDFVSERVGFLAGAISAADLMMAILNLEPMSESLFVCLSMATLYFWLRATFDPAARSAQRDWLSYAAIGLLAGIAILTRPAALYLPIILVVLGAVVRFRLRRRWVPVAALLLGAWLLVVPWIVRNHRLFQIDRLTTADTINLLYFTAAGAYQVDYGIDGETARARIAKEFAVPSLVETNNFWLVKESVAEMDARQRAAAAEIIRARPLSTIRASVIGLAKSLVSHNAGTLATISGRSWEPPGSSNLLALRMGEAAQQLGRNGVVVAAVFVWEVFYAITIAGLAGLGVLVLGKLERPLPFLALLGITGYYLLTTAVVGIDAYSRHRAPIGPLMALFAAVGLSPLLLLLKPPARTRV